MFFVSFFPLFFQTPLWCKHLFTNLKPLLIKLKHTKEINDLWIKVMRVYKIYFYYKVHVWRRSFYLGHTVLKYFAYFRRNWAQISPVILWNGFLCFRLFFFNQHFPCIRFFFFSRTLGSYSSFTPLNPSWNFL